MVCLNAMANSASKASAHVSGSLSLSNMGKLLSNSPHIKNARAQIPKHKAITNTCSGESCLSLSWNQPPNHKVLVYLVVSHNEGTPIDPKVL